MTKRVLSFVLALIVIFQGTCIGYAESPLLLEDFSSLDKVDTSKTDAVIEPDELNEGKPVLKLPRQSAQQALDFVGDGLVLADKNGVRWMTPESGTMTEMFSYTDKSDGDIIGVLTIPNTQSIYAWTDNKVVRLDYDGSSVSKNPIFPALGLDKVVSVSQLEHKSGEPYVTVIGYNGDDLNKNYVQQIWGFDGNAFVKISDQSITGNPLAITGGTDLSYFVHHENKSEYFTPESSGWSVNPAYNFSHTSKPASVKGQGNDMVVLEKDKINWYNWTGEEHLLSQTLSRDVSKGVTLAVHHDKKMYAYIDESGSVHYYQYDGNEMIENPSLQISGVELNRRYIHPKNYQTKILSTSDGKQHNVARLVVESIDTNPYGVDKVTWEVSTDGGISWQPILPTKPNDAALWTKVTPGSSTWLLRGTLDTLNDIDTPRIKAVSLYTTYMDVFDIQIQNVSGVAGSYPTPPPAIAKAGSEVAFTLKTKGVIGRADATMKDSSGNEIETVPLTLKTSNQDDENEWAGKFVVPTDYTSRYSGDISITVTAYNDHLTGADLATPVTIGPLPFLTFGGTLYGTLKLRLVE